MENFSFKPQPPIGKEKKENVSDNVEQSPEAQAVNERVKVMMGRSKTGEIFGNLVTGLSAGTGLAILGAAIDYYLFGGSGATGAALGGGTGLSAPFLLDLREKIKGWWKDEQVTTQES